MSAITKALMLMPIPTGRYILYLSWKGLLNESIVRSEIKGSRLRQDISMVDVDSSISERTMKVYVHFHSIKEVLTLQIYNN